MGKKPVVLCILDGWGYREDSVDNAIKLADTPTYDRLWDSAPRAMLQTSGLAVGLPDGQMGNSEVGHMNLGGGRVIMQDLPRIDAAIADGSFDGNQALQDFIATLKTSGGTAHIMGLLSPGGVHSHQDQMVAMAKSLADHDIRVAIHAFLDGRDTPPRSADGFMAKFEADIAELHNVEVASVTGRYWAMDRDKRWDRVQKGHGAVVDARADEKAASAVEAVTNGYARGENDEFIEPTIVGNYIGMADGDGLIMANFRADRAREILTALVDPSFDGFERDRTINFGATLGLVEYSSALNPLMTTMFAPTQVEQSLGEVIADAGLKQLRIAETEKYAHVTFFFNGGKEAVFDGEERILIPSPDVATYDLKPEMSAHEVTDNLVKAIESGEFSAVIVNFANPDMVGHTGILSAAMKACETIDACITRLEAAVLSAGGDLLITADHGNVELMTNQATGVAHTAHTNFDVPILMINAENKHGIRDGRLADVAPTVLALMGLEQPTEMSGENLLVS